MKELSLLRGDLAVGIFATGGSAHPPDLRSNLSPRQTKKYLDNADRPQGVTITRNDRGQQQAGKTASSPPQL